MPKPVPPPPPQPSAAETAVAVRHARWFAVLALALYFGFASMVGPDSFMVKYGRENGSSWNLWKLRTLNEDDARGHKGGKVAWLVGSSMLRDSFDVKALNRLLVAQDSEYRAVKFGQSRGATGMARGIVQDLPLREGDVVLHGMSVENQRANWVEFTQLPDWRIMLMNGPSQIWRIDSWGWQKKLEATVAVPRDFFMYQEEAMEGWFDWLNAPFYAELPKNPKGLRHLEFRRKTKLKRAQNMIDESETFRNHMRPGDLDLSPEQYNVRGLLDVRSIVEASGAELVLFEHIGRAVYQEIYLDDDVEAEWNQWFFGQPETVVFPRPPDDGYYDMKHPNSIGRAVLTAYLAEWLDQRWERPPESWVKNRQQESPAKGDVLPSGQQEASP